jgi:REP element-mobilizing transposase RayT
MRVRKRAPGLATHRTEWGGTFFITFNCAESHKGPGYWIDGPLGEVEAGAVRLNALGKVVEEVWNDLPVLFRSVELGKHVTMPDHFHGILQLRAASAAGPTVKPLSQIVGAFKMMSSKRINELKNAAGSKFWHNGFYDRIIHNASELHRVESYILNNPVVLQRRAGPQTRENGTDGSRPIRTIFPGLGEGS